jgi:hypothetical protein
MQPKERNIKKSQMTTPCPSATDRIGSLADPQKNKGRLQSHAANHHTNQKQKETRWNRVILKTTATTNDGSACIA